MVAEFIEEQHSTHCIKKAPPISERCFLLIFSFL